jgi:cob(I)alamin adenosyltransferase
MTQSPQEKPVYTDAQKGNKKGLIIVHTGDGKGKTTAAFGMAFRAAGHGMKVAVIQFIKGKWASGEVKAASQVKPRIEVHRTGEGFTWDTKNPERDRKKTEQAWELCKSKLFSEKYDLLVFDEIHYVIDYDYLQLDDVLEALRRKPAAVHVVLTGRNAPGEIIALADLVTEMKLVKHPFKEQSVLAQAGVEF